MWDLHAESLTFGNKYLFWDGIHYNSAGHKLIAERPHRIDQALAIIGFARG